MADEKYDPTDESDPSAARGEDVTSDDREPTGRELLEHGPDHVDSLGGTEEESDEAATDDDDLEDDDYESDELARAEAEVAEDDGDGVIDDEEAALAASRVSRRPVRRSAESDAVETSTGKRGRTRKGRATAKQKQRGSEQHRTTPAQFVGESVGELRKVVWPTGEQMRGYFAVVLVFVLFIIAFVSLLDLAYGWALLKVFG